MNDNAGAFREYRTGANAPDWGPAFWKGYDEFVPPFDIFAEAWDQFREMSYGDLQGLEDRLRERAQAARKKRLEVAGELTTGDGEAQHIVDLEHPELRYLNNANTYFWQRANAAASLTRYIEELGPPPKWEDLNEAQKRRLSGTDAPRYASHFVATYRKHSDDISSFGDLHDKAATEAGDRTDPDQWRDRRRTIRDRMNDRGVSWQKRNVDSFIEALAELPDVEAHFGVSEEGSDSPK